MLSKTYPLEVYVACGNTDMRKSIDGLAAIVQESFLLDPFSTSMFVFCNKKKNKLKILRWEHNGFWLYYRRLEKGQFQWPNASYNSVIAIDQRELSWLLDGLSMEQKGAHKKVVANTVV